jgi:magnesium-transporting ATPase (P-type)
MLARQFTHFFALMLWVAAVLAWFGGLPQLAVAIAIVIVINGLFAFAQEHRAERAAERLRDLLPRRATVVRDGVRIEIDATELVRDDLVWLSTGDHISADLQTNESHGLSIDTSTLTGESVPVQAGTGERLFAGTWVVAGEGLATVTATGGNTRLAGIARVVRMTQRPPTPLTLELHRVVRVVAVMAICSGIVFFLIGLLIGLTPTNGFLFAIGVTVALVPEGLLPTVTLSLAMGAQRMAHRNALVRRLEAVETLGSTTFICTDKTGTLTRNEMEVIAIWTPSGRATIESGGAGYGPVATVLFDGPPDATVNVTLAAARCSTGRAVDVDGRWQAVGDPMEAAIDALVQRLGIDPVSDEAEHPITRRFPFDAQRRWMAVVSDDRLIVKGAPDAVIPSCVNTTGASEAFDSMAARGLRVIAVAEQRHVETLDGSMTDIAHDLTLLGLLGLEDPPRESARAAVAACREAGIRVAMLTGDYPATATAIATEVGLLGADPFVIEGRDLPDDDAALGELVDRDGIVVSRVTPEDKHRIARALRARGHVVAMTGDGVNDGPALQEANIGIAMGRSGTDVAREAADLILLDDDFATIVDAITEGRATYHNVRRFLTYHLTDNVAELTPFVLWAATGGTFPLALGVLQILALDIVTDAVPALALGTEPPNERSLHEPPIREHLLDGSVLRRAFLVLGPVEAFMEMLAFLVVLTTLGWSLFSDDLPEDTLMAASGAAFAAVVIGQMANAFACRSTTRWPGALGWTTNRLMLVAVTFQALALSAFLFIQPLADLLDQAPPPLIGGLIALLAAPAVLAVDAAQKTFARRNTTTGGERS